MHGSHHTFILDHSPPVTLLNRESQFKFSVLVCMYDHMYACKEFTTSIHWHGKGRKKARITRGYIFMFRMLKELSWQENIHVEVKLRSCGGQTKIMWKSD